MPRTIKLTLVLVTLLSYMEIYCSCAVVTKPTTSASANNQNPNSDAVNQMAFLFKNIVNALFMDTSNNGISQNRNSRIKESASAYNDWDNDLFNFNPNPDPFRYRYRYNAQKHRKLTPIDLSKPFVFDDEEEIKAAKQNPLSSDEFMEQVESFDTPEFFKTESPILPAVLVESPTIGESDEIIRDTVRGKVSDSKIPGFIGSPIQTSVKIVGQNNTVKAEDVKEAKALIKKRSPNWGSSLIFPDDPEYNIGLRPERTTDSEDDAVEIECKEHETYYNSKCSNLFEQGPCGVGEHLVEDTDTGEGKCLATKCKYPESVSLAGTGECVMLRYHTCPEGMRLTMLRTGQAECDCRAGFLYSAKDEKCYEAYKQGPCRQSQYFILHQPRNQQKKEMPKCIRNPCKRHGFVCYGAQNCPRVQKKEDCLELGTRCENGKGTLVVNQTTLAVVCRTMDDIFMPGSGIETRILSQIPELACSPGTKKDITGTCRKTFRFNRRNGK